MKTRRKKQIVDDFIRFINIMNDLVDVTSIRLKELDERTGDRKQVPVNPGTPEEMPETRDITVDEMKHQVKRGCQNVIGYYLGLTQFIDTYGEDKLETALTVFGYDFQELKSDIQKMVDVAKHINNNVDACKDKTELKNLSNHIDTNIQKLPLIRRSWCRGE